MKLTEYAKNILVAVDQLINALCLGWPDETLSSRAFRWNRDGLRSWPCRFIDRLFFWDVAKNGGRIVRHCELSYISEKGRFQLGPEFRG
ncbi:pseudouridine synthase [uncultured Desulfovibrio sp.]|uniref:pseudouridine synthase n=1 Tax=uncultured Desulfovibrio sp. TaxID=167968 RepID=UPI0026043BFB|nr:pseudouridine synthase [uncultured Desulfovibrio sp.]